MADLDLLGRLLGGRYRVTSVLGQGGMGVVFGGVQEDLQRKVALKVVSAAGSSPDELRRFRLEALAASQLGHPNIVQVTDFREASGDEPPFLVMEQLEGESLKQLITREHALPPDRAVFIATQMLAALAAAHAAQIVHRDIKPANIFLTRTQAMRDLVKVLDFGVAKMIGAGAAPGTADGAVVGTLAYMAPEQALGMPVDGRADLYAVGACLFEMLAGRRPIVASDRAGLVAAIVGEPIPKLASVKAGIDPALAAVVDRALSKDPHGRHASAVAMLEALAPFSHAARLSSSDAARTAVTAAGSDAATTRGGTALLAPMTVSSAPPTFAAPPGPPAWTPTPAPAVPPPRFTATQLYAALIVGSLLFAFAAAGFAYVREILGPQPTLGGGIPRLGAPSSEGAVWDMNTSVLSAAQLVGDETDDAIGFVSQGGKDYLAVFDGSKLKLAWKVPRAMSGFDNQSGLAIVGKKVAVAMEKRALALIDGATGRELARYALPRKIEGVCPSDAAPTKELFVELDGVDVMLDVDSGVMRDTTQIPRGCLIHDQSYLGTQRYCRRHAPCAIMRVGKRAEEVAIEGGLAIVSAVEDQTADHLLAVMEVRDPTTLGGVRWQRTATPPNTMTLVDVVGGRIYVETETAGKRELEVLDVRTGEKRWSAKGTPIAMNVVAPASAVAAGKNRVFVQRLKSADVYDSDGKFQGTLGGR